MFIHPALHMNSRLSGAFPGSKEKEEKRMKLSENEYQNYTAILRAELIPAMGCTEPIAIAYAAAEARRLLGEMPTRITVNCSGNMIKNVKGVTVPNSGGQKGIEVAAILGMVGGDPDKSRVD